mmetsp:Transcript_2697/g.6681  ORF Transcript_2697/g.6681 Transcript_2697/m.6681 type:complete len:227 (-) Transcript_2697:11-691(-)
MRLDEDECRVRALGMDDLEVREALLERSHIVRRCRLRRLHLRHRRRGTHHHGHRRHRGGDGHHRRRPGHNHRVWCRLHHGDTGRSVLHHRPRRHRHCARRGGHRASGRHRGGAHACARRGNEARPELHGLAKSAVASRHDMSSVRVLVLLLLLLGRHRHDPRRGDEGGAGGRTGLDIGRGRRDRPRRGRQPRRGHRAPLHMAARIAAGIHDRNTAPAEWVVRRGGC